MYKPKLYEPIRLSRKRTRQTSEVRTHIMRNTKTNSLDQFKRSYLGSIHQIWAKIPQTLIAEGQKKSWQSVKSRTKKFLTGQWQPSAAKPGSKKHKQTNNGTKQHNIEWNAVVWKQMKDQGKKKSRHHVIVSSGWWARRRVVSRGGTVARGDDRRIAHSAG